MSFSWQGRHLHQLSVRAEVDILVAELADTLHITVEQAITALGYTQSFDGGHVARILVILVLRRVAAWPGLRV